MPGDEVDQIVSLSHVQCEQVRQAGDADRSRGGGPEAVLVNHWVRKPRGAAEVTRVDCGRGLTLLADDRIYYSLYKVIHSGNSITAVVSSLPFVDRGYGSASGLQERPRSGSGQGHRDVEHPVPNRVSFAGRNGNYHFDSLSS
jgi:hypothetical protein